MAKNIKAPWASDQAKYDQALEEVKKSGKEVTDEAVKEVYRRLRGLVLEKESQSALPEEADATSNVEAPRSRRRTPKTE